MSDMHALKAAAFLIQALDLDSDAAELAAEVVSLKRDALVGVVTVELESSAGPAAFLIYDYQLAAVGDGGETGQSRFDSDLATLEKAATLDTPGPRILAHATTDGEGFILATTPSVFRALTGISPDTLEATGADLIPGAETANMRAEAAGELIRLLREADDHATRWLRAIQAEGSLEGNEEDLIEFGEAEAALALFLIDDRSIQHLLRAIRLFVESAGAQTGRALGTSGDLKT